MLSAWKKFINKNDQSPDVKSATNTNDVPPGIQKLDKELQRKFARGVNYNMKVVIKGDKRVGKTSLFLRLKGYGFQETYNPTENLNVTSIDWSYKATDDVVKIDLWEAIDVAVKKDIQYIDLKLDNGTDHNQLSKTTTPNSNQNNQLIQAKTDTQHNVTITAINLSLNSNTDSPIPESARQSLAELGESLDVYKGTNAVILMMDMTKLWTFKYVQTEFPKIPKHIPVLVVGNHRDQGHHRTVSPEQATSFVESLDRGPCDGIVMYTESSMKNGFGLKLIERFLNIPFLKLQEASLLKQIELNRRDFLSTVEELQMMQESTNREYEQYLELRTLIKRQQADAMSPVNAGLRQLDDTTREQIRNTAISSSKQMDSDVKSIESNANQDRQSAAHIAASQKFVNDRLPSIVIGANCPLPDSNKAYMPKGKPVAGTQTASISESKQSNLSSQQAASQSEESDEDELPSANPLVAGYQSDIDSDDQDTKS